MPFTMNPNGAQLRKRIRRCEVEAQAPMDKGYNRYHEDEVGDAVSSAEYQHSVRSEVDLRNRIRFE